MAAEIRGANGALVRVGAIWKTRRDKLRRVETITDDGLVLMVPYGEVTSRANRARYVRASYFRQAATLYRDAAPARSVPRETTTVDEGEVADGEAAATGEAGGA